MAKQDLKATDKPNQQQAETSRAPKEREGMLAKALYPAGMMTPGDFFRMGPISLMRRMNEEMSRMFGEMTGGGEMRGAFAPPIEVMERDGKYVIRAELPGVKAEDISLNITENAVVITGEHHAEHEEEKGGVHVSERRYGNFYRAVPLPEGARADDATAHFENGILEIEVPAAERKTPARQIPIQSAEKPNKAA